jgi:hypothetical protein
MGYRAVPYLLWAAPPAILLLTILVGGCTMTRTSDDSAAVARPYADANSPAGKELVSELDRRAMRQELRRLVEEAQR